jgi:glyoxylase-like metal-dependent hydrolase (beta-lactamase superfamily II)
MTKRKGTFSMKDASYCVAPFAQASYALVLWDATIQSYINCYLLLRPAHTILIDTGKAEHLPSLIGVLGSLGVAPEDVTDILATHGHRDHVGAAAGFPAAARLIHAQEASLLTEASLAEFSPHLPDNGVALGLQCRLVNQKIKSPRIRIPKCPLIWIENVRWPPLGKI